MGCSFKIVKTELTGTKKIVAQAQQWGQSHTRLQLPYVFFGLGRINNYIENFNLGVSKTSTWSNFWTPIIPNSWLFVTPNNNDPTQWLIEIFINPTKALALIILSTLIVLAILGIVIMYYHKKEKDEGKKENERDYNIF